VSEPAVPAGPVTGERPSWLVFAAFSALYAATAATSVQGGDAGEYVTVACTGGVAHPSGYPLFLLLAGWACALPVPAPWAVAATSCLVGAGALGLLHRAVWRLTGSAWGAATAVGALGFSGLFWRWTAVQEVLSGACLTVAAILLAAVHVSRGARGPRAGAAVGLAFATGVAHHHSAILMLPLLGWATMAAVPRPWTARGVAGTVGAGAAAGSLGFLPYLLLLRPGGASRWGDTETLSGLVHHFLRADYGTFGHGSEQAVPWWEQPMGYATSLIAEFPGLLFLLAGIGVYEAWRRDRGLAVAWVASWVLAGPLFMAKFALPYAGYTRVVVDRFHPVPNVLFAGLVGLGAVALLGLPTWPRRWMGPALIGASLLGAAATGARVGPQRDSAIVAEFFDGLFTVLPPRALLVGTGDSFTYGCLEAQAVRGLRPDVVCIPRRMLGHAWFREDLVARHPGLVLERDGAPLTTPQVVEAAQRDGRPVYVSPRLGSSAPHVLEQLGPAYPAAGAWLRVAAPGEGTPPPRAVAAALESDLNRFPQRDRITERDAVDHELEAPLWEQYGLVWAILATGFDAAGDAEAAELCRTRAYAFAPWLEG
jgi:hypothetical protein